MEEQTACPRCQKIPTLCVCAAITPLKHRAHVVILQHPQEPDKQLGTGYITHLMLPNSTFRIGLSIRSLSALLGKEVINRQWGVLYLGSAQLPRSERIVTAVDKKGSPLFDQDDTLRSLQGVVILDGTWSQAKALWWRNPWLLKLQRLVLTPPAPSLYGVLRKEPRREALSTIEAAAYSLTAISSSTPVKEELLAPFKLLLEKARLVPQIVRQSAPRTGRKDYRRRGPRRAPQPRG